MALFELPIYGDNDEILTTYKTDKVRWGVFVQAIELQEEIKGASAAKQFKTVSTFVKKIFPNLTDADLEKADFEDVMNTFAQLVAKSNSIKNAGGGGDEKNAVGEA